MPSVLFETSFISNPGEEKRLATADYRQKLADAIVNAVKRLPRRALRAAESQALEAGEPLEGFASRAASPFGMKS